MAFICSSGMIRIDQPVQGESEVSDLDELTNAADPELLIEQAQDVSGRPAAIRGGQCVIICRHRSPEALEPVRNHFTNNGLQTYIGLDKETGDHVLCSSRTFESIATGPAKTYFKSVIRVGNMYNTEKPANALAFKFDSYWASVQKVKVE